LQSSFSNLQLIILDPIDVYIKRASPPPHFALLAPNGYQHFVTNLQLFATKFLGKKEITSNE
jgi:hypothetical protein